MAATRIYELYPHLLGFSVHTVDYRGLAYTVAATSVRSRSPVKGWGTGNDSQNPVPGERLGTTSGTGNVFTPRPNTYTPPPHRLARPLPRSLRPTATTASPTRSIAGAATIFGTRGRRPLGAACAPPAVDAAAPAWPVTTKSHPRRGRAGCRGHRLGSE